MTQRNAQRGFTLMELMITVAVVGILAAIAYPSFTEQIARSRRAEAQTVLLAGQQWMERFYSENYSYRQTSDPTNPVAVTDPSQFPSRFSTSPPTTASTAGSALYAITVSAPTRDSYTITATRKPGTSMAADRCGNMTVDHLGRRSLEDNTYTTKAGATKTAAIAYCWK